MRVAGGSGRSSADSGRRLRRRGQRGLQTTGGIGGKSGVSVEMLARTASEPALANAFRFVFLAGMLLLCFGLAFLIAMEEKPLRGPAAKDSPPDMGLGPDPH